MDGHFGQWGGGAWSSCPPRAVSSSCSASTAPAGRWRKRPERFGLHSHSSAAAPSVDMTVQRGGSCGSSTSGCAADLGHGAADSTRSRLLRRRRGLGHCERGARAHRRSGNAADADDGPRWTSAPITTCPSAGRGVGLRPPGESGTQRLLSPGSCLEPITPHRGSPCSTGVISSACHSPNRISERGEQLLRELDHRAAPAAPDWFRSSEHAAVGKELEPRRGSDLAGVNELVSARQ